MVDLEPMLAFNWGTPTMNILKLVTNMTESIIRMQAHGDDMQSVYLSSTNINQVYEFGASGKIQHFAFSKQTEIIRPNRLYLVDIQPAPGGAKRHGLVSPQKNQDSIDRYGVMSRIEDPPTDKVNFLDQAEIDDIAESMFKRITDEAAEAIVKTPPNVFLEVGDRVKVDDTVRLSTGGTAEGHISEIRWKLNLDERLGPVQYEQDIQIGGIRSYLWRRLVGQGDFFETVDQWTTSRVYPELAGSGVSEFIQFGPRKPESLPAQVPSMQDLIQAQDELARRRDALNRQIASLQEESELLRTTPFLSKEYKAYLARKRDTRPLREININVERE